MSGWGAERLTREELLGLCDRLHRAWDASVQQAERSPGIGQMRQFFAVASEMCQLGGEAADELIVRAAGRPAQAPGVAVSREPEAGS